MKQSWDNTEPSDDGGSFGGKEYAPSRFWIPKPPEGGKPFSKRIMFLDTIPFCLFEHGLFKVTNSTKDKCICLKKNGLDERGCPPCDDVKDVWPYFIGYLTIIDMGDVSIVDGKVALSGWRNKEDELFQFIRKAYGAKRGGTDRPGMLQEVKRQMEKRGGLVGTVWDSTRTGKLVETIGDKLEFVERVEPENWEKYFLDLGAADCKNELELKPFEWMKVFKHHSYEQLANLVGVNKGGGGQGARSEGADYGGSSAKGVDEDVPF